MGKKRRVLNNPKFANLRKHPKYAGMVAAHVGPSAAREQEKEESYEIVAEQPKPEIIKEPEIAEILPEPKAVKLEKPKPAPETKTKSKTAKKTTIKKTTRKKK